MNLEPILIQYGIRLRTVLFPFTALEMIRSLEKKGYELNQSLRTYPVERVTIEGPIARKGKIGVIVDSGSQYLGIAGEPKELVLTEFKELETQLYEDHNVKVGDVGQFYIFQAAYSYKTSRKPYETIRNAFGLSKSDELSAILGADVSLFEFRVGGTELHVNDVDWFDIKVSPNTLREDAYQFEVGYRNPDKSKTETFIQTIESKLLQIVKIMER